MWAGGPGLQAAGVAPVPADEDGLRVEGAGSGHMEQRRATHLQRLTGQHRCVCVSVCVNAIAVVVFVYFLSIFLRPTPFLFKCHYF